MQIFSVDSLAFETRDSRPGRIFSAREFRGVELRTKRTQWDAENGFGPVQFSSLFSVGLGKIIILVLRNRGGAEVPWRRRGERTDRQTNDERAYTLSNKLRPLVSRAVAAAIAG